MARRLGFWDRHYDPICKRHVVFPMLHWILHTIDMLREETRRMNAEDEAKRLSSPSPEDKC